MRNELSKRLQAVADLVTVRECVADIGTDHGKLPVSLLLSGRVNAQNIRIINLLLYELIQDPLFWATLTSCPCPETLNNQINRLLK